MKRISEAPAGVWAWAILLVGMTAYVIAADLWLHRHGFEYMTTEFKEAAATPWGPILWGLWFGTFIGLTIHFATNGGH